MIGIIYQICHIFNISEAAFRAKQHPGGPLKMTFVQISPSEVTKTPQQGLKHTKIRKAATPHPSKSVKYHNGTLFNGAPLEPVLNQDPNQAVHPKEVTSQNYVENGANEIRNFPTPQNSQVNNTAAMRSSLVITKPQIYTQSPAFNTHVGKGRKYIKKGMKTSQASMMPNNPSYGLPSKPDLQNTYSTEFAIAPIRYI